MRRWTIMRGHWDGFAHGVGSCLCLPELPKMDCEMIYADTAERTNSTVPLSWNISILLTVVPDAQPPVVIVLNDDKPYFHIALHRLRKAFPRVHHLSIRRRPRVAHTRRLINSADEDFINKSLLDQLDAQADAEPISSSSDSEHPATSYSSASNSSPGSSSAVPYHISMQSQHQSHPRPDSPSDNASHHMIHHIQSQESSYALRTLQNGSFVQGAHVNHVQPAVDYSDGLGDSQKQKMNNFHNSIPRSSFTSLPNATRISRHHTNSSNALPTNNASIFRDPSASSFYPPSDMYQPPITSPTQAHMQQFDPRSTYDFGPAPAPPSVSSHQNSYVHPDPYPPNPLPTSYPMSAKPQQQQHTNGYHGSSNSFVMSSQTPYGPHIPTSAVNIGGGNNVGNGVSGGNASTGSGSNGNNLAPEDISTIFVVGFPDDMHEREFQNMFTFSSGFEAATLKIPNKEYTAYSGLASAGVGSSAASNMRGASAFNYSGSNDPYNIVTVNQGGVVVDGGRDGTMASWPAGPMDEAGVANHFYGMQGGTPGANLLPRKQIIGFAKFRSREEALLARDVLQGRRVDMEKGAVLKAEMAKKNLHTKRGPGPIPGPGGVGSNAPNGGNMGMGAAVQGFIGGGPNVNQMQSFSLGGPDVYAMPGNDALSSRDRELAALGAMGLNPGANAGRVWPQENANGVREEEDRRRDGAIKAMGLGHGATALPRRLEEDEQKERKRWDKDTLRMRSGSAYDAFHYGGSLPSAGAVPTPTPSTLPSAENGSALSNGFLPHKQSQPNADEIGPWDHVQRTAPNRPSSSSGRSSSPPHPSNLSNATSHSQSSSTRSDDRSSSPFKDQQISQPQSDSEDSRSSSVTGHTRTRKVPANTNVTDISRAVSNLAVATNHGNSSPELPSPESGASSGGSTRNGVDQNPPINTLYVGNLPISPPPPHCPQDILEESLRELFKLRPGFRRLSFKQKSSGPMCFVEFEDVNAATKTIQELYGHTLNGLVKGGGIRLSYSKNPLGVRTPTSATAAGSSLQQQQHQPSHLGSSAAFPNQGVSGPQNPHSSYMVSAPPPRFSTSTTSQAAAFSPFSSPNNGAFLFGNNNMNSTPGYRIAPSSDIPSSLQSFSPFDVSGAAMHRNNIPDQNASDPRHFEQHQHYVPRTLSPNAHNVEAARAG
ncbi:hypothetical protein D9758_014582 [Tetrapyrgos nigripes]|uniref:RRM domain-containing protein n=1 Tax=Tetrapyrgos nigripes TaxID=182062 RepID=A0A8H5BYS4_9AGAR|nr:hypothetical protein D9758_014582 [Tetrapyrgos nigripes]